MLYIILWHVYIVYKIYSTDIVLVTFMDVMTKCLRGNLRKEGLILTHSSRSFSLPWLERFGFSSLLCLVILCHMSGNREKTHWYYSSFLLLSSEHQPMRWCCTYLDFLLLHCPCSSKAAYQKACYNPYILAQFIFSLELTSQLLQ